MGGLYLLVLILTTFKIVILWIFMSKAIKNQFGKYYGLENSDKIYLGLFYLSEWGISNSFYLSTSVCSLILKLFIFFATFTHLFLMIEARMIRRLKKKKNREIQHFSLM